MRIRLLNFGFLLASLCATATATTPDHPLTEWREQARIALESILDAWVQQARENGEELQYSIALADERLRFTSCGSEPAVSSRSAANSGRLTFVVACSGPQPWQLHVPVKVDRFARVAVTRQPLLRKNPLGEGSIEYRLTNTADLSTGYYKAGKELEGLIVKRSLPAGTVLHPGLLEAPMVVRKGEQVVMISGNPVVRVRTNGVALTDGRLGEQIVVENPTSQRRVKALVTGRAQVEVPL